MYNYSAKSVDDQDPVSAYQRPRGYRGVAILWHKTVPVEILNDGSDRTQAVNIGKETTLINSYLPCRGTGTNDAFCQEVDIVEELCTKFGSKQLILTGDLNMDPEKHTGIRVKYLQALFQNFKLKEHKPIKEPTFVHYANGSSKIDYILSSKSLPSNSTYGLLPSSTLNTSPHRAIMLTVKGISILNPDTKKASYKIKVWDKVDEEVYRGTVDDLLADYPEVHDAEEAIQYLIKTLNTAADKAVPTKVIKPHIKPKPFNEDIKTLIADSKKIDWVWKREGKPAHPDPLYTERNVIRKKIKRAQNIAVALASTGNEVWRR